MHLLLHLFLGNTIIAAIVNEIFSITFLICYFMVHGKAIDVF